ncbi:hypothetical protein [Abyssisolibacter fermentans]|nr:hypothetical protein [Abyssisolibacter fermentans]
MTLSRFVKYQDTQNGPIPACSVENLIVLKWCAEGQIHYHPIEK